MAWAFSHRHLDLAFGASISALRDLSNTHPRLSQLRGCVHHEVSVLARVSGERDLLV
jgi:hypothetical protein